MGTMEPAAAETNADETHFTWEGADHPQGPWQHLRVLEVRREEALSTPYAFEMELAHDNAGADVDVEAIVGARAALKIFTRTVLRPEDALSAVADHPGAYPRNPMGKGYLVVRDRVDGVELPNLKDPDDLLTDDRLVVGDPRSWHHQPLPWTLGWQHVMALSRLAKLGADARFPEADTASLKEVQKGFLPADYRERGRRRAGFEVAFQQEASLGMTFAPLGAETPIAIDGVHPERRTLDFVVPPPPRCEIAIEGHTETPPPLLTAVVLSPEALRVSFVYVARTSSLPRRFIPGVHPTIPLSATVDGGVPVHHVTPAVRRRPAA
jgi:hypothetical protein